MVFLSSARVVLDQADISRAVRRLSHEIVENSRGSDDLIILGIPTRGVPLARRIAETVAQIEGHPVPCGAIDVTLYRDDLRLREVRALEPTDIPAQGIDGCTVVLVDDVLYSGRTIRAALDAVRRGRQAEVGDHVEAIEHGLGARRRRGMGAAAATVDWSDVVRGLTNIRFGALSEGC